MISLPLTLRATPGKTTMGGGGTHHWMFSGQKTFVGANFVQPHLAQRKFANIVLFLEDRKRGQRAKHRGKKASPIPGHTCLHFFFRLSVSGWPEGKYWCLSFLFVYGILLQDLHGKCNIRIKILWNIDILFIYGINLQDLQPFFLDDEMIYLANYKKYKRCCSKGHKSKMTF